MTKATEEKKPTLSVLFDMATKYGMEPAAFEETVRATCSPTGKDARALSRAEFAAFLLVAKEYGLNPLTKEIYAYPRKDGGIAPVVSVDGWINLINSHPQCDGWDTIENHDEKGNLISVTTKMFRKDRAHPTVKTEYLAECVRDTIPWKMKHRMLGHKSLIQTGRQAFGFAGIYDEDTARDIIENDSAAERIRPPAPPVRAPLAIENKPSIPMDQVALDKDGRPMVAINGSPLVEAAPVEGEAVVWDESGEQTEAVAEAPAEAPAAVADAPPATAATKPLRAPPPPPRPAAPALKKAA